MKPILKRFLLVDDDPINNLLTKMMLKKSFENVLIHDFTVPEDGLGYIKSEPSHNPLDGKTTLFLDINMPTLSGWEFLKALELFDTSIKERYNTYMLSSSINLNDINLAKEHPYVKGFIEKPLNKTSLSKIFEVGYKC
jgi:response regulator RpfG family c-di-GMP phosphodiesterase